MPVLSKMENPYRRQGSPSSMKEYMRDREFLRFQPTSYHETDAPLPTIDNDTNVLLDNARFRKEATRFDANKAQAIAESQNRASGRVFMPIWSGDEDEASRQYTLFLFGREENGFSVTLALQMQPVTTIALPESWTQKEIDLAMEALPYTLAKKIDGAKESDFRIEVVWKHTTKKCIPASDSTAAEPKLAKFAYAHIYCKSWAFTSKVRNRFRYTVFLRGFASGVMFDLIETFVHPVLQLLQTTNGAPCGTMDIPKEMLQFDDRNRMAFTDLEARCVVDPMEPSGIRWQEGIDKMFPTRTAAFDVEVQRERKKQFPRPERPNDVLNLICTVIKDSDSPKQPVFVHHCLKRSPEDKIRKLRETHPEEEIVVVQCKSETELLMRFRDMILLTDPDWVMTFNGHRFDMPYMDARQKRSQEPTADLFYFMSRLIYVRCDLVNISFTSNATSRRTREFVIPGRTMIDQSPYIRGLPGISLCRYSLKEITKHFLGHTKEDVSPDELFDLYLEDTDDAVATIVSYCITDSKLLLQLSEKLNIIANLYEMSKVTFTFISDLLTRGQMFKINSQLFVFARRKGFAMVPWESLKERKQKAPAGKYKGAIVFDPLIDFYDGIVTCIDFEQLYPSIMQLHNLCITTHVAPADVDQVVSKGFKVDSIEVAPGEWTHFQCSLDGLMPQLLKELITKRKAAKDMLKLDKSNKQLEARQQALKVSCNSVYGFCGTEVNEFACMPVAKTVTCFGRQNLRETRKLIEEMMQDEILVIYGDTDSVFLFWPKANGDIAHVRARVALLVAAIKKKQGINIELDKLFKSMLLLSKKKYIGRTEDDDMSHKGTDQGKRDRCEWHRDVFRELTALLMLANSPAERDAALGVLRGHLADLMNRRVDFDRLVVTVKLSDEYANEDAAVALKLFNSVQAVSPGVFDVGDRIPFVVTEHKSTKLVDKVVYEDFARENPEKFVVDVDHIKRLLKNALGKKVMSHFFSPSHISSIFKNAQAECKDEDGVSAKNTGKGLFAAKRKVGWEPQADFSKKTKAPTAPQKPTLKRPWQDVSPAPIQPPGHAKARKTNRRAF